MFFCFPWLSKFLLATSFQPAAFQASNEPSMDLLSHQDEDITSSLALACFVKRLDVLDWMSIPRFFRMFTVFLARRSFGRNEKIDHMGL